MKPPSSLETKRLRLRAPVLDDAESVFATYARDPEVTRYLTFRPHQQVEQSRDFLQRCATEWAGEGPYTWVITRRETKRLIGGISFRPQGHRVELGYALGREHWGHGFMTEAVRAVTEWALGQPEVHRVWAVCDIDNGASARVLEKAGMEREGRLRGWTLHPNVSAVPRDCWCYARAKEPA